MLIIPYLIKNLSYLQEMIRHCMLFLLAKQLSDRDENLLNKNQVAVSDPTAFAREEFPLNRKYLAQRKLNRHIEVQTNQQFLTPSLMNILLAKREKKI